LVSFLVGHIHSDPKGLSKRRALRRIGRWFVAVSFDVFGRCINFRCRAMRANGVALSARTVPARLLSHRRKQWLEIGMLPTREPILLIHVEAVAGMTDGSYAER
jgi:hypothetical protein